MSEHGEWSVPRFLGQPFLDKPFLFFWAQLASVSLFGMSANAIHVPGVMLALTSAATTGWLGRVLLGRAIG